MEYMPKGSLYSLLHTKTPLDWTVRLKMATEMACGLAYLHAENILHRDIKSQNMLLDDQYHVKLADFGLAKIKTETKTISTKPTVGTLAWMAPELFGRKPVFTKKSDIYSLGMTLWEIASRKIPFEDAADPRLIPSFVSNGDREDIPADCPPKLASLIAFCWHKEVEKRPSAAEIVEYLESSKPTYLPATAMAAETANVAPKK
jgi:serine/threonine protein kinase